MKQSILMVTLLTSVLLLTPNAFAASSEVTWKDYESYRDIDSGNENRKSFRERTFRKLEEHFAKLATSLPDGQVLKIEVTDVDLAGDTHVGGINQTRIIKQIFMPRMNFSYQLLDADGKVIQTEAVVVKDMNFMSGINLKYRNDSLGYEKKMLDDWFKKTFKELIVSK
ncbi:DUF3016 domain-containing protein [Colwellia psychrerythraea]|uniref:DUF3016 domain-containing protein n=1 Tax=Colwellia psychrerythraea TaxID=28229 RepID=A0A099KS04_COLPS|nr:DUF3016 domain-containing protein [Colwellia psychrerythraea]KGJ93321.1 Protein of unknown function DUF3016 [Colwellia psychrerythraea]